MNFSFNLVVFLSLSGLAVAQLLGPLVEIPGLGKLRGQRATTLIDSKTVYRFKGIPYAIPPVGERRFMPSELFEGPLPTGANGEFRATEFPHMCVQNGLNGNPVGNEDCLGLNVYSPELPTEDGEANLKHVMVFVHGGAFTLGSGDMYTGARLLDRDVVLVSINYRLGLFGFFSMGNDEAPGNSALFDVLTALQWVQKYIHHFGGDPNQVTVCGQSAGSALVTHLLFSPLTEGLVHKVIGMSSGALSFWALEQNPLQPALEVARYAGCNHTPEGGEPDIEAITFCMKQISSTEVSAALYAYTGNERFHGRLGFGPIAPVIQKAGSRKFLVENPIDMLKEKRQLNIPLLAGGVKHDGSFIFSLVYLSHLIPAGVLNDTYYMKTNLVPNILTALGIHDETYAIYDGLAEAYMGDKRLTGDFHEMQYGLIDIHTVLFMAAPHYRLAQLHSELQPNTYWYSFDYYGRNSLVGLLNLAGVTPIPAGISHGDDMMYIFFLVFTLPGQDQIVSQRMLDHWANFMKYGNPTPPGVPHHDGSEMVPWPAYTMAEDKYMSILAEPTILTNYRSTWIGASDELADNSTRRH